MAIKDTLSGLLRKNSLKPFPGPDDFMFGVATADHQCEAYDPDHEDIRDWWEKTVTHVPRKNATDFWNRYEEDIELAARLGCNAFRFSIAWSRVQPDKDRFDDNAFEHYRKLINKIIECRMKPVLTLHHFTWPMHVEDRGGMIGEEFPKIFEEYAAEVAERFAELVPYWITFNEPNLLIGGYLSPWMDGNYAAPPGLPPGTPLDEQMKCVGNLIRNLFLSHRKAYDVIKAKAKDKDKEPDVKVGVNQYVYGLPIWLQWFVNRNASAVKSDADLQRQVNRLSQRRDLIRGSRVSGLRTKYFEKNKVDVVIAALTRTPEREQEMLFSKAYFVTEHKLLRRAADKIFRTRKDLDGKRIAMVKGSTSERVLRQQIPHAQPKAFADLRDALNALDKERVDAVISDSSMLSEVKSQNASKYELMADPLSDEECYAVAIPQGENRLLEIVDEVVADFMKSQKMQQWRDDYGKRTGQEVKDPPPRARALVSKAMQTKISASKAPEGSVLRRIQDRDCLVVGVREEIPGTEELGTANLRGLEVELAQALARRILGKEEAEVHYRTLDVEERISALKIWPDLFADILKYWTILSTILMTDWWYMGMKGRLDPYLCPDECEQALDFVGLDYYWGIPSLHLERIMRLRDAADRQFDLAPVWPYGLHNVLKHLHKMFPDKPLIIFENGSVRTADGWGRTDYLRAHLKQVQRAVQDNLKVEGYFCWSITSNREWDLQFNEASDFGLYRIELDNDPQLKRHRTGCADTYEKIIGSRKA